MLDGLYLPETKWDFPAAFAGWLALDGAVCIMSLPFVSSYMRVLVVCALSLNCCWSLLNEQFAMLTSQNAEKSRCVP